MASGPSNNGNAAEIDRLAFALAKEPGSKAFIPLAEEYGKAGMWQEAAGVLEDGLKVYPNFITAMVALGRAYDQLNLPVKAKAILEEAIKLSPENLRAHRTLAKIYVSEKAKEAALRSCAVILAVNPQDQEALSIRAALVSAEPGIAAELSTPTPDPRLEPVPLAPPSTAGVAPVDIGKLPVMLEEPMSTGISPLVQNAVALQSPSVVVSPNPREVYVRQLEQWLAGIQRRRRPRSSVPSQS